MKKKIYLAIFAVALSMVAAPGYGQPPCTESTKLTMVVNKYHLVLNEKVPVCLRLPLPATFTIRIVDAADMIGNGDVSVVQKDRSPEPQVTIVGENGSISNRVSVTVDGKAEVGDVFDYFIYVDGVGLLDPKIRIIED